jgi:predicted DNA-binding transcriptional regulator AlpA
MDNYNIEDRLDKIEKLLTATKNVLTFDEGCSYTGYSPSYMHKMCSANTIPYSKPNGKAIFFDRLKLDAWLLRNHRKSKTEIEDEANLYALRNKK